MSLSNPQDPELVPGTVLAGKYRIDEVIGRGGMGVVVAATHLGLEQRVALKFLLPAALGSMEATERFAREARAAVRLRSEHVARVLDVGQMDNGAPYIVMEFLEGSDLADRIGRGPVAIGEAVDFVLQASEALAEAHALGIVHRDLKPRNLFLTRTVHGKPLVKVLDFGISKLVGPAGSAEELSLTRTSAIMGSPNYMSPEQLATPRNVDARTDVWSLGVILYELIAGRLPFQASTITELCARVFQEEPDRLNTLRADVPLALAAVVATALEKKLDARWPNVQEMARALAPFAADPSIAQRVMTVSVEDRASMSGPRRASTFGDRPMPSASQPSVSSGLSANGANPSNPSGPQLTPGTVGSWSDAGNAPNATAVTGSTSLNLPRGRRLAAIAVAAVFTTAGIAAALAITSARHDAREEAAASSGISAASTGAVTTAAATSTAALAAPSASNAIVINATMASDAAAPPPLTVPTATATTAPTTALATAGTAAPVVPVAQTPHPSSTGHSSKPKPKPPEDNNLADDRH